MREQIEEAKDIRKELRRHLPGEAFGATPSKLLWVPFHIGLMVCCALTIRSTNNVVALAVCAVTFGHSMSCLGFLGHDYSHGTILRGPLRYLVGVLLWAPTMTSQTVWHVNHVEVHHQETNTLGDSFRYFSTNERSWVRSVYALLFLPNRWAPWSPLQAFTHVVQQVGATLCALFGVRAKQFAFFTGLRPYTPRERLQVAFELACIVAWRVSIITLAGGYSLKYFWAGTVPSLVAGGIGSAYLYTQHTLYPLAETNNPLQTTSLRLPRLMDFFHMNVSHHTAHHLFEGLNSRYLPQVTRLLEQHYPEVIDRRGMFEALRLAQHNPLYKPPPQSRPTTPDGVLLPAAAS